MGVCILGMGECGSKSTSINNSNKTLINEALTKSITNTSQGVTATIKASQTATIKFNGGVILKGCPNSLNVYQNLKVMQDVKLNLQVKSGNDLKNQVANAVATLQTNDTTQKQGFLTTGSVDSNTSNNISEFIKNVVSNDVWNSTAQSLSSKIEAFQKGTIEIDGPFTCEDSANSANIVQEAIVEQLVGVIMDSLYSTAVGSTIDNKSDSSQGNKTQQDNSGLGGVLNSLIGLVGGGLLGVFLIAFAPAIIVICLLCCCCMAFKKGGSSAPAAAPAAAKSAFGKKVKFV
jgi:hypothetical protein